VINFNLTQQNNNKTHMALVKTIFKVILWLIIFIIGLFTVITLTIWIIKTPSNNREWEFGQQTLQNVIFDENNITIKDLRDYDWRKTGKEENYIDFEFKLSEITGMEVGEAHFSPKEGIAHIFLIFNLENSKNIALSIETRREVGEEFALVKGLKFDYEIIYILTTKEDLLSLREERKERVYVYPIKITQEKAQELFKLIALEVNELYEKPKFYHLFFGNCTNLITDEVEKISDKKFPLYEKTFAPGYAGRALFEMGILDIDSNLKNIEEVQNKYLINFNK